MEITFLVYFQMHESDTVFYLLCVKVKYWTNAIQAGAYSCIFYCTDVFLFMH